MIGSIHGIELHGMRIGFSPLIKYLKGGLPDYDPAAQIKDWDLFFRTHLEVLRREFSEKDYSILGHCTMLPALALAPGRPEEAFPEWWEEELISLLLTHHVALEISNRWRTPYDRLMEKAVRAGVAFSVGSDGHSPERTCDLAYPRRMIGKFGVREDRIFDIGRKLDG
jgi:histidinol phosphatase-like PHP family hydrolase